MTTHCYGTRVTFSPSNVAVNAHACARDSDTRNGNELFQRSFDGDLSRWRNFFGFRAGPFAPFSYRRCRAFRFSLRLSIRETYLEIEIATCVNIFQNDERKTESEDDTFFDEILRFSSEDLFECRVIFIELRKDDNRQMESIGYTVKNLVAKLCSVNR